MQCPVCTGTQLVMSERQGIEIDYCPQCRGVWLDRGELDKIIERSAATSAPEDTVRQQPVPPQYQPQYQQPPQQPPQPQQQYDSRGYPQQSHGHYKNDYQRRKKKGFLGELFDFD